VVVDLRKVNALTKGQAYVMKDIQQLLEEIAGHEYISGFDFTQGYNQIPMAEDSKEYTAFAIPGPKGGQYHFTVMPFGLKGAPATFQQFMDDVFRPFLGEFAVVYIDDLAVYSNS
jgi:putative NADPH-quinone reductase